MIQRVVVLGAGSAGLLAALTLKKRFPEIEVRIVRDPSIGIIGVGEGSTPNFVSHLFDFMGVDPQRFYETAKPTWKLGIHFKWGPRGDFNYTFDGQFHRLHTDTKLPLGFLCMDQPDNSSLCSALMSAGKAFPRHPNSMPDIGAVNRAYSFHIENENLVKALEFECREAGVTFTEGKMVNADQTPDGIKALHLEDGTRVEADLFVDASGFRAELIGGVLDEPFVSFEKTLFCDRAVVGGWERTDEPILPYTTAEQMDCGWAWQIEHEHFINRGYVFASDMISDADAFAEFKAKNPKVPDAPRFVSFKSGYRERGWVKNVVAVGNAAGFVEPLEASALMMISSLCQNLALTLQQSLLEVPDTVRDLFNRQQQVQWEVVRDFLGIHYKYNTAMDTPFWKRCREETDLSGVQDVLDFYEENGPSALIAHLLPMYNDFGVDGFLSMLAFNKAPCKKQFDISPQQHQFWDRYRSNFKFKAAVGVDVQELLTISRDPRWKWS